MVVEGAAERPGGLPGVLVPTKVMSLALQFSGTELFFWLCVRARGRLRK